MVIAGWPVIGQHSKVACHLERSEAKPKDLRLLFGSSLSAKSVMSG
jgi:hypothetical protein